MDCKNLDNQARSSRPLAWIPRSCSTPGANQASSIHRVSGELSISQSSVVNHLCKSIQGCWIVPYIAKLLIHFSICYCKTYLYFDKLIIESYSWTTKNMPLIYMDPVYFNYENKSEKKPYLLINKFLNSMTTCIEKKNIYFYCIISLVSRKCIQVLLFLYVNQNSFSFFFSNGKN